MNISRILFLTDFSELSNAALEFASRLASESKALLLIVHVDEAANSDGASGNGSSSNEGPWDLERNAVKAWLCGIKPTVPNVAYEHRYLSGSPVSEILKFTEHEEIDVIVLGSHGRNGLSRLLTGSVAEGVMRKSTCPVLIVRRPVPVVEDVSDVVLCGAPG
jgi:nucleotide-binding universal stress UspA family protein